jgi:nicotinate-nucleotide pyrophosphorylase (carboxylating)
MDDIDRYLTEDLGVEGDITSESLLTDEKVKANIIARENCIIAGLEEVKCVFQRTHAHFKSHVTDGSYIKKNVRVAHVHGLALSILKAERVALNILGRMSGIATVTNTLVKRCRKINPKIKIAATRKTTPGFRFFEKKAVILGGGESHRYGLYDAILIKDNHLKCVGSLEEAIHRIKKRIPNKSIEIEVETEQDAITAAKLNVEVIMLDNINAKKGAQIAKKIRQINPHIVIEVSGGVTPKNFLDYVYFADRISLGYLTHSIKNNDFTLEIE